jgi:hypothetical protein
MASFLRLRPDGSFEVVRTVDTSDGATDADEVPSLNEDGILDPSIVGAATTGSSVVIMTGPDGRLDPSTMPTGVGADTANIPASEAISSGRYINIYDDAGVARIRLADAGSGREADGFVLEAYDQGDVARVYFEGFNTQVSGLTAGKAYLSLTPGGATSTPVTGAGNMLQVLGTAYGATVMYFKKERPVYLA